MKKSERIFSDEELKNFSKSNMMMALEAIDAGDLEKAKDLCSKEAETHSLIHDLFVNWLAAMLSYIYDNMGEESAVDVLREVLAPKLCNPEMIALRKKGLKEWINWCIEVARSHNAPLTVEEDEEKFTLTVECTSGGKLIQMGAYEGQNAYRKLRKAGPHTWGETDVPIYCGHCPILHEIMPIQIAGQGSQFWVHASPFPKKPGDPCVHIIYKNPKDIPDKYYKRLGLEKDD